MERTCKPNKEKYIRINSSDIERVNQFKYLGSIITNNNNNNNNNNYYYYYYYGIKSRSFLRYYPCSLELPRCLDNTEEIFVIL
jgi:hypothetical protein